MDSLEVGRYWDANAPVWIELSRSGYDGYRDVDRDIRLLVDAISQARTRVTEADKRIIVALYRLLGLDASG